MTSLFESDLAVLRFALVLSFLENILVIFILDALVGRSVHVTELVLVPHIGELLGGEGRSHRHTSVES